MAITQLNDAKRPYTAYIQTANFRDQEEGMFPFTYWLAYAYDYTDITASEIEVEVPPGAIVLQVGHQISETLTGITAITAGDDGNAAGWIADAWVAGAVGFYTDLTATYAAVGKRYDDGDTIDVAFTGIALAGSGKVFVKILSYTEVLTGS
jgi:hypothetical protein